MPEAYEKFQDVLWNMTTQSVKMVRISILSCLDGEIDGSVDNKIWLYVWWNEPEAFKKLILAVKSKDANKKLLISIINIKEMSNIERIAYHALNIAETFIYIFLKGDMSDIIK